MALYVIQYEHGFSNEHTAIVASFGAEGIYASAKLPQNGDHMLIIKRSFYSANLLDIVYSMRKVLECKRRYVILEESKKRALGSCLV